MKNSGGGTWRGGACPKTRGPVWPTLARHQCLRATEGFPKGSLLLPVASSLEQLPQEAPGTLRTTHSGGGLYSSHSFPSFPECVLTPH